MSDPIKIKKSKRSRDTPTTDPITPTLDLAPPAATTDVSPAKKSKRSSKSLDDSPAAEAASATADAPTEPTDDSPALSHKEKRLAKRRKLAGLPERAPAPPPDSVAAIQSSSVPTIGSQRAPGSHEGGITVGATPAKGAHGIWVGNMNFATTSKDLLAWFEERGLKEVTRINMPKGKRSHENNRGFAYLDFPTETDVTIAVGASEQHLDGRKLLIKSSSDYSGRPSSVAIPLPSDLPASALIQPTTTTSSSSAVDAPQRPKILEGPQGQTLNRTARKILDRQRNPAGPTLFLGNLGFETKVEDIRMMFDAHQRAASAWAPRVKGEKREKGGEEGEGEGEKMDVDEESEKEEEESEDEEEDEAEEEKEDDDTDAGTGSDSDDDDAEEEKASASGSDDDANSNSDASEEAPKPKRIRVKKKKAEEKEVAKVKAPLDLTKAKDAGIRKIRLGTFEDTGKCKGWAFVDFHLPEQCTRALLNIRNHSLDGRTLNVEYASSEAVRRGGLGTRAAGPGAGRGARGGAGRGGGRGGAEGGGGGRPARMEKKGRDWDDQDVRTFAAERVDYTEQGGPEVREFAQRPRSEFGFRPSGPSERGGRGGARGGRGGRGGAVGAAAGGGARAKPGAALAGAQRASTSIVESTGRKITFD